MPGYSDLLPLFLFNKIFRIKNVIIMNGRRYANK